MKYCDGYAALLDLYIDGELAAEEMERVQAHLKTCPGCQAYVDDALAIRAAFPEAEETEVPEGFCEDVMARVRAASSGETGKKVILFRRWARVLAPLAACCALVLVLRSVPSAGGGMENGGVSASGGTADMAAPACGADLPGGEGPSADAGPSADVEADVEAEEETALDQVPAEDTAEGTAESGVSSQAAFAGLEPQMRNTTGGTAEENEVEEPSAPPQGAEDSGEAPRVTMAAPVPEPAPEIRENIEELEKNPVSAGKKGDPALTLTEAEAGDLLDGFPISEEASGVRRYELTREEFSALCTALGLSGGTEPDGAAEEPVIVEVRMEP